jgi:hypothetical protein
MPKPSVTPSAGARLRVPEIRRHTRVVGAFPDGNSGARAFDEAADDGPTEEKRE